MKQATQLQIPFDDYEAVSSEPLKPSVIDRAELGTIGVLRQAAATVRKALPTLVLFAQAVLFVSFGFAIMFFAAIIQG